MKQFLNELKVVIFMTLFAAIVGYLLLVLVNLIPVAKIMHNARISAQMLLEQKEQPEAFLKGAYVENFSDCDALGVTLNKEDNRPFYYALYAFNYTLPNRHRGVEAFSNTVLNKVDKKRIYEHSQEWHGFQLWLRPLLMWFDISDIRYLCFFTAQFLMILVCMELCKTFKNNWAFVPFLVGYEYFNYTFASLSILLTTDICVMLLGCLAIMYAYRTGKSTTYIGRIFAIIGILASYFSMFNMPMITIGFPMIVWLATTENTRLIDFNQRARSTIANTFYWFGGYAFMTFLKIFLTKWLVGAKSGMHSLTWYTGMQHKYSFISRLSVLREMIYEMFTRSPMSTALFATLIIAMLTYIVLKKKFYKDAFRMAIPYLCVASYPVIWTVVLVVHASMWWTVILYGVSIFAFVQILWNICVRDEKFNE